MTDDTLKGKTAKGLLWSGLSNGIMQLLNLLFGIMLARMLTPADYGMVGMLSIFSLMASSLQESGFTQALINRGEIRHTDYNAVFWFNALVGVSLYLLLWFCAPLIAAFYGINELIPLARYSFLGFLLSSLGIAHAARLRKQLKIRQTSIATLVALAVSGTAGVIMAYCGFAYWGIATQSILYIGVCNALYWHFSNWRPTWRPDFTPIREMLAFSSRLLLTNLVTILNNNLFAVILGRFYTRNDVGYFNQANKWSTMGQSLLFGMTLSVAQPVFAEVVNDPARQYNVFRKLLRFVSFVSFPLMLGLALIAPELISIAITDKWMASVPMLQMFCVSGAILPIGNLYQQLVVSCGRSDYILYNVLLQSAALLCGVLFASPHGIHVMVSTYVSINICWLLVWHLYAHRIIGLKLVHTLKDVLPFALIAAATMMLTHFITCGVEEIHLRLLAKMVVAVLLYVATMWMSGAATFKETLQYILKMRKR